MILRSKYNNDTPILEYLKSKGTMVSRKDYRIDLTDFYCRNGVKIEERIIVDPVTMIPWFVCFSYFSLPKEKRRKFFEAVKEISNGVIFRSSSDSDPTIRVNALLKHPESPDEKIMEEVKKYFLELEKIIQND